MATAIPAQRVLRFGPFELNLATGELRKFNLALKLRPQAARVLVLLASQPGDAVTREKLRDEIWGNGVFVDFEHALNVCIRQIRAALDDDADKPRYIETVPRLGYRFIAHVEEIAPAPRPIPPSSATLDGASVEPKRKVMPPQIIGSQPLRQGLVGALLVAGIAALVFGFAVRGRLLRKAQTLHIESLAVLPLQNLSHDPEQEYFADGMTDELITDLANIHSVRVISRNSIMQYKGKYKPAPEIARELNVDAVVEGTVVRSGDRVRITAQLIDAKQDRHLWAKSYEREMRDVLQLQDDLALDIAGQVAAKLTPTGETRLAQARPVDPEAYEMFLRGRHEFAHRGREYLQKGLAYFQQSAKLDPNYAPTYVGIAESYGILGNNNIMPADSVYPQAKAAALKALELDPDLSEAHVALAEILNDYEYKWTEAEKEYRRAIELDPNNANAHHWYAMELIWMDRAHEAIKEIETARQLDPAEDNIKRNFIMILVFSRQYDLAMAEAQKWLELEPDNPNALSVLALGNVEKGNTREAISELQERVNLSPNDASRLMWLAYACAVAGDKQKTLDLLAQMKRLSATTYVAPSWFAVVYGALGKKDEAFAWLDKAVIAHDGAPVQSIKVNPLFDPLRSDPRFAEVLRRKGLPE